MEKMEKIHIEKKVIEDTEIVRRKLLKGMKKVVSSVSHTMGAKGQHTLITANNEYPLIINDGIQISRQIKLSDPIEDTGATILIDTGNKIAKEVGDNSTLVQLMTYLLCKEGFELLEKNEKYNSHDIIEGMQSELEKVLTYIEKEKQVATEKDLFNVAFTSSRDKKIAEIVVNAIKEAGHFGQVLLEHKKNIKEDMYKTFKGLNYDTQGYLFSKLNKDKKSPNLWVSKDTNVILINESLEIALSITPLIQLMLDELKKNEDQDFLIVCNNVTREIGESLYNNFKNKKGKVQVFLTPTIFSDKETTLKDFQIVTGAEILTFNSISDKETKITREIFGKFQIVHMDQFHSSFTFKDKARDTEEFKYYIKNLRKQLKDETITNTDLIKHNLENRISQLNSGIVIVMLKEITKTQIKEKHERVDDGLRAVRSAERDGIIVGGGVLLKDYSLDRGTPEPHNILLKCLIEPFINIVHNFNGKTDIYLPIEKNIGFDVRIGKECNLLESGVLDTSLGLKIALDSAVTNASEVLKIKTAIVPEDKNN